MVIALQAVIGAVIGFLVALAISSGVAKMTADAALPVVMTPGLTLGLFALTVIMCVVSGFSSIIKVMRVDRDGIRPMIQPLIEAIDIVKVLGSGAGRVEALKGVSRRFRARN